MLGIGVGSSAPNDHKSVLTVSSSNRKDAGRPGLLHTEKQCHRLVFILIYMDVNKLLGSKQGYLILATAGVRRTLHRAHSYQEKPQ